MSYLEGAHFTILMWATKKPAHGGGVGHHPGITRAPYQLAWPGVGHTPGFTAACLPQMRGITQPWLQQC